MERTALDAPCVPVSFTIGELRAIMGSSQGRAGKRVCMTYLTYALCAVSLIVIAVVIVAAIRRSRTGLY